jgi:hypothetical protein
MEYFKPLITWKIQKGIRSKTLSLEEIYAKYSGSTNQLKIKNCLKDYYENHQLKWVLLGGDNTVVPIQECYGSCSGYTDNTMPCDLFYACFDNAFDWNANGNNIVGELDDKVDLNPEIYISRLPIRTIEQITAFVNKLLKYEKQPSTLNYVKKMLFIGTQLWNTWNGQSDAHQWSEKIYNDYIADVWNGTKYRFYDTGTDFTGDASYDLNSSNLQTQINNGYHFLHVATHGSNTIWSMETGSNYNSTNASALQNGNASIIVTMACYTNAFDQSSDPCLSEAFIRNSTGACIAYWGSSRYGWGVAAEVSTLFSSFLYDAYFYDQLFKGLPASDSYKFAAITTTAKQRLVNSSNSYSSYRWLQYTLNAIGDPEMPIFTDNPLSFSNITISQNGTTVTVNSGGISGCTIALTSSDAGTSYFEVAKDVSSYTFNNVNVPYCVSVTKHNYIPFVSSSIIGKNEITCKETTFSLLDNTSNATYTWTTSSNIQLVSGQNTPAIKVKGNSYNATDSWIKASVTSNGQTYTSTKDVVVNIPKSFILSPGETTTTAEGSYRVRITAVAAPDGVKPTSCVYHWSAEGGTITTMEELTHEPDIAVSHPMWLVIDSLTRYNLPEVLTIIDEKPVKIKQVASAVSNLSPSKSTLYEVTEDDDETDRETEENEDITDGDTKTKYLTVEADRTSNATSAITRPEMNDWAVQIWSPNSATLTYTPGSTVTVFCEIDGCKAYSASLKITYYPYNTSYLTATRSICLVKDQTLPAESTHTYRVQLFNDYGYVKTVSFTSNETTVSIPLNNLSAGNYYINVVDEENNIVERKLIPAY